MNERMWKPLLCVILFLSRGGNCEPISCENNTEKSNRIENDILSINLTIADQKTEICKIQTRLEKLESILNVSYAVESRIKNRLSPKGDDIVQSDIEEELAIARLLHFSQSSIRLLENIAKKPEDTFGCSDEWVSFNKWCFLFVNKRESWRDAKAACESKGGYLARLDNPSSNAFVRGWNTSLTSRYWVGGMKSEQGNWVWSDNLETFNYTDWCPYEPSGRSSDIKYCLNAFKLMRRCSWSDRKCKFRSSYVCQKPRCPDTAGTNVTRDD